VHSQKQRCNSAIVATHAVNKQMSWPAGWTSSPPIARGLIAKTSCRNYSLGDAWRTGNAPRWLDSAVAEALAVRSGTSVARVATIAAAPPAPAAKPPPPPATPQKDIDLEVSSSPRASAFKRIFCAKAPKCVIA
jgi:hypothetical protein